MYYIQKFQLPTEAISKFLRKFEWEFDIGETMSQSEFVCPNKIGPYQLRGTLGKGAFGTCKLAYRSDLDIYYACKIIQKTRLEKLGDKTRFEQEIRILQEMRHPRIVQLYDLYRDSINYYIFMEYCPNGELFSHIVSRKRLPEDEVRYYFKHILDGIAFIHSFHIAHRDLKPENVLIDADGFAKISDFGLSKYVGPTGITSTSCGSPCYVSPEILSGKEYNAIKSDMWSAGVILYAMVTGQMPWSHANRLQLFHQIKACHYHIPPFVSDECVDLIQKLITADLNQRLTAEEALNHPFMLSAADQIIEWKEVPIVSLRRLDNFFAKDPSDERIKLKYRPSSFGKRKRTFQKEEKLLMINTNNTNQNNNISQNFDMVVKPSQSTWINPEHAGVMPCETATRDQIKKINWKNVVKKHNRKSKKATIIKPMMNGTSAIL